MPEWLREIADPVVWDFQRPHPVRIGWPTSRRAPRPGARRGHPAPAIRTPRGELLAGPPWQDGLRWGFVLCVDGALPPAAVERVRALEREVVAPIGHCRGADFELSFLKTTEGPPPTAHEGPLFDGLHLDTHPELRPGRELLRVLINVAPTARTLRYEAAAIDIRHRVEPRGAPSARGGQALSRAGAGRGGGHEVASARVVTAIVDEAGDRR